MAYRYGTNPAELNHRITFLNPPGTVVDGWPSMEWTEHRTVWAAIKTPKGYQLFNSDATQWQNKRVFAVRYREDLTRDMRIRFKGVLYKIESTTNDDERNQWLTIIAKEVL